MVQGDTTLTCIILASYIANAVMIKTEQYRAVENTILRNWWSFSQGKFKHRVFFLRIHDLSVLKFKRKMAHMAWSTLNI